MKPHEEAILRESLQSLESQYATIASRASAIHSDALKTQAASLIRCMNSARRKLNIPSLTRQNLIDITKQEKDKK